MTIHTGFKKGQRIIAIMKSGQWVVGKFDQSKSGYIFIEGQKIRLKNVRSTSIYKPRIN